MELYFPCECFACEGALLMCHRLELSRELYISEQEQNIYLFCTWLGSDQWMQRCSSRMRFL